MDTLPHVRNAILAILAASTLTGKAARAQTNLPALIRADLVRVTTQQRERHVGGVLYSTVDSLIITGGGVAIELGRADVRRIELGMGETPWRKAEIGGYIGLAAGLTAGLIWVSGFDYENDSWGLARMFSPVLVAMTAGSGMAVGSAAGLVVGLINPSERWLIVYPPRSRLDVIFGSPGRAPGLGLRIAF